MAYGLKSKKIVEKEKPIKTNPYFVEGKDMSQVPIYVLEEDNNGLSENQEIALWQYGVDTGVVWQLQGWYGRTASDLLEQGIIQYPKKKTNDFYGNPIPTRK